jgi:vancomycin resistance protein VanW
LRYGRRVAGKSMFEVLDRRARVGSLSLARLADWWMRPARYPGPRLAGPAEPTFPFLVYERTLPIGRDDRQAHPLLEAGKAINLALAAPAFDGLLLEPGRPLSFWRTLGPTSAGRGYRHGMEFRSGCVVPTVGGGICLLSTALFQLAAHLGFTILERHGHSIETVPPRPGELWGLDASVFNPYVDLCFVPRAGRARLEVAVADGQLRLAVRADAPSSVRTMFSSIDDRLEETPSGPVRHNRIVRGLFTTATGAPIERAIIAVNRRRIVPAVANGQSCLTCGDDTCWERPAIARASR